MFYPLDYQILGNDFSGNGDVWFILIVIVLFIAAAMSVLAERKQK